MSSWLSNYLLIGLMFGFSYGVGVLLMPASGKSQKKDRAFYGFGLAIITVELWPVTLFVSAILFTAFSVRWWLGRGES
jgi:hypothetical protein